MSSRKSCLAPECGSRGVPGVGCWAGEALSQGLGHTGTPGLCPGPTAQLGKSCPAHLSAHCLSPTQNKEPSNRKKKCKMHLKILFHFPFRQKQKFLNNRGQKQLLQNFQESGKIKSPVRRTGLRFSLLSCPVWGTPRAGRAAPPKADSSIPPGCSTPRPSGPWDTCPLASLTASFQI